VLADVGEDDVGEQESREDEEEIDADIAAVERDEAAVKEDNQVDSNRADAVELWPVGPGRLRLATMDARRTTRGIRRCTPFPAIAPMSYSYAQEGGQLTASHRA